MNSFSRKMIMASVIGMSVSGVLIYLLTTFFYLETEYGLRANPWIGEIKLVHNLFNFIFIFSIGRIYDGHIRLGLAGIVKKGRFTGLCLYILIWIMTISGCLMLYIGDDTTLATLENIHAIAGFIFFGVFIIHKFFMNKY